MEILWVLLALVAEYIVMLLKPEWFALPFRFLAEKVVKNPDLANKIENPMGIQFIKGGFAIISRQPNTSNEKQRHIEEVEHLLEEYKKTPVKSTFQ